MVESTHGNAFQSGFPDLFASHAVWGQRWIEVKVADAFEFTPAQLLKFPVFEAHGAKIWVLTEADDKQYELLFKRSNLQEFMTCFLDGCHNIEAWRRGERK